MCSGQQLLGTGERVVDSYCWLLENVNLVATVWYWRMCSGQLLLGTGE